MNDYITRQEFEQAIESLRCYGDQQTINVTQTPGGQVVTSTQVISTEPSDTTSSYITVSYDSGTTKFTVTVTNMPYLFLGQGLYKISGGYKGLMSATFIYDKPATGTQTLYLGSRSDIDGGLTVARLYWWSSDITTADATTAAKKTEGAVDFIPEFIVNIIDDGTHTITRDPGGSYESIIGTVAPQPYISVIGGKITLKNVIKTDGNLYNSITYSAPFDDFIIIGYSATGAASFDEYANRASYSSYVNIGEVVIDSSNVIRRASLVYNSTIGSIKGLTTSASSGTFNFENGILYSVT